WRQIHQTNNLSAELLDQHLSTLSSGATPQVISTDRHTVKPWFQGRLPFSFNLPDAQALPPDTTLRGANLTYLRGQPAALLLFTIHSATTPDLQIVAVSDVNPADLDALVAVLAKAQSAS